MKAFIRILALLLAAALLPLCALAESAEANEPIPLPDFSLADQYGRVWTKADLAGKRVFINYNFTVQDDAPVTIGDDCNFGPNCTIVTPVHPMLPDERFMMLNENGEERHMCYAKPVVIGHDCWFGANVVVCPGVTIGDGCVIGAGSVVTRDIPSMSFAAGVPCRVIREITEEDTMANKPEILGANRVKK